MTRELQPIDDEAAPQRGGDRITVPAHVVYRSFVAETVILNLQTGFYHGLNPVAARVLALLEETGSVVETITLVAQEYRQDRDAVARDIVALTADLLDRGLLEWTN